MVLIPSCAVQHNAGKTCCQASVSVAGACEAPLLLSPARACLVRPAPRRLWEVPRPGCGPGRPELGAVLGAASR